MVAGWMLHFVLISALLTGAGLLLEGALRRVGWPQRGVWAAVLAASVGIPVLGALRPAAPVAEGAGMAGRVEVGVLEPVLAIAGAEAGWRPDLPGLDPLLLGLWAGASVLLLLFGTVSGMRLRRAMRGWSEAGDGEPGVLISECTGPAVVGIFRGVIVLPRWAEGDTARELILAHEREHLRAGDPVLLLAARLVAALLPWNLPLWLQLHRLHLTVEVDCDARVLRRGSDLRSYATLLLEVGRRRAGLDPALVAFAEPASFLERRLRIMTRDPSRRGWAAAAMLACGAVALAAGACGLDQPAEPVAVVAPTPTEDPVEPDPGAEVDGDPAATGRAAPGEAPSMPRQSMRVRGATLTADTIIPAPSFSPRDTEPELRNRSEFARVVEEAYPASLRDAGIGGRVLLWVHVNASGAVEAVRVSESSGYEQLDAAAMAAMERARFAPATLEGRAIPVWIALPLTFRAAAAARPAPPVLPEVPPAPVRQTTPGENPAFALPSPVRELGDNPAFTPRTEEPRLQNRRDFARELERAYPAMLKDAGIGGRVLLWVFVDATGRVGNVRIQESSGYEQLDAAAESVLRNTARFTPAKNREEIVPVWIALPVTFQTTSN